MPFLPINWQNNNDGGNNNDDSIKCQKGFGEMGETLAHVH
jgi:hypothetical protein